MKFFCLVCEKTTVSENIKYYCDCGNVLEIKDLEEDFKKVSMGEGNTPLIFLKDFNVYVKLENINPTGSFKDRGSVIEIGYALSKGYRNVCTASTGNMAISISAYSAFASLNCTVFLTKNTSKKKLEQIKIFGAKIVKKFKTYTEALKYCESESTKRKWFLCGDYGLRIEGHKIISHEIVKQLNDFPDVVIVPVGNGNLFYSLHKGFSEMGKIPKIIGVEASGCDPLYKAFIKRSENFVQIKRALTKASAIACEDPIWGRNILKLCYQFGHEIYRESDKNMEKSQKILGGKGIYVELASASVFSTYLKLRDKLKDKKVVLVLTGSGLKS
ncbi:MAG: pyridoxal-phosphate dependent enzyme [Candidatus Aenigmatarchaeota archaeon]